MTSSLEVDEILTEAEIDATAVLSARSSIAQSLPYKEMLSKVTDPMGRFQDAVARAIVAETIQLSLISNDGSIAIRTNANLRNEVVNLVRTQLGPYQAAVGKWVIKQLFGGVKKAAAPIGTSFIRWRRGGLMDETAPVAGDVLLYQSRGQKIRDYIRFRIDEEYNSSPPVFVIGHSLGGVALVELLVLQDLRDKVKLLVTVGSQAPFFYEIDALQSLRYGDPLPEHFPCWVNVYDHRDFLSFVAKALFPGRVEDYPVNNGQPFPESHSAYWSNPDLYGILAKAISLCPK
jgi:hypothetical protein